MVITIYFSFTLFLSFKNRHITDKLNFLKQILLLYNGKTYQVSKSSQFEPSNIYNGVGRANFFFFFFPDALHVFTRDREG